MLLSLCTISTLSFLASAASFPPTPTGVKVVKSTKFPGVSISYKEVATHLSNKVLGLTFNETKICETTNGVKGYSGYVHLPPSPDTNRSYEAHMYFWFFTARKNAPKAPLALWLQGGPGVPSITAALTENGPCNVLDDSKTTELNPWSWNDKVNMLYIDQPVQVSFSYNNLTNGTIDEVATPYAYKPADFSARVPETNLTFLTGTFAAQDPGKAPNTTLATAPVLWDFMQTWIQEFPKYKAKDNKFSIWGESYGAHYAPAVAEYIYKQNDRIASGDLAAPAVELKVEALGVVDGCFDINTQMDFYAEYAFNNTYGFQGINETQYEAAVVAAPTCKNMTATCRSLAEQKDPLGLGNNAEVNKACLNAYQFCFSKMHDGFTKDRAFFDIAAPMFPSTLPKWAAGYLNRGEIQQALGVPVNFTGNSLIVSTDFFLTGDFVRDDSLIRLGPLLDRGVKIALLHGDRDFQCNWLGGEAASLAIKSTVSDKFKTARYTEIKTNATYTGGLVRQVGNLSFSVVFQAGHEVPKYQPETAYQIFNRVMAGKDVATGIVSDKNYSSKGSSSAWRQQTLHPDTTSVRCYVWDVLETCTAADVAILRSGNATTENFILIK